MRRKIAAWLLQDVIDNRQPNRSSSTETIDFAEMERAFLSAHQVGLTESGNLAWRVPTNQPGPAWVWRALPDAALSRHVHDFLVERNASHLWSTIVVAELRGWLAAAVSRVPSNEKYYA
jgi:hypothetical protein